MEQVEFLKIGEVLRTAFPKADIMPNQAAMQLWYEMLKDLDTKNVQAAVRAYIATKRYPPTVADIRAMATPPKADWSDAWGEVMKAVGQYGYSRPIEALKSMTPETRRIVERFGWQEICQADNIGVLRGQFKAAYNAAAEKDDNPIRRKELQSAQRQIEGDA